MKLEEWCKFSPHPPFPGHHRVTKIIPGDYFIIANKVFSLFKLIVHILSWDILLHCATTLYSLKQGRGKKGKRVNEGMRKRWKEGGVRNEGKRGHLGEFEFEIWPVHALTSPHSNPPSHLKHLLNSSISLFNNAY